MRHSSGVGVHGWLLKDEGRAGCRKVSNQVVIPLEYIVRGDVSALGEPSQSV